MKIVKIQIANFRLLKDISIDLEDELSLIIGKNNCGKTSLLVALEKFISRSSKFSFDDFNIDIQLALLGHLDKFPKSKDTLPYLGIKLILFVEYGEDDDLSNVGNSVIMDLDPNNNTIALTFEYSVSEKNLDKLHLDYHAYNEKRAQNELAQRTSRNYVDDNLAKYFKLVRKSVFFDRQTNKLDESVFVDLDEQKIQLDKILAFKMISAKRNVSNKESNKTLSAQSADAFSKMSAKNENSLEVETFHDGLINADTVLTNVYSKALKSIIGDVAKFGGLKKDDTQIKIISTLQSGSLLKDNTTVKYALENKALDLPENHNGLGYLNLISMIFEIRALLDEFAGTTERKPADINLLFIEEPEAHTHPQMQYVFIKNIKNLLRETSITQNGERYNLQSIISTHSSHIVSESKFDDIKFLRKFENNVKALNLRDLSEFYQDDQQAYKFLKQYLTIHRSELFFADKAIFIEGDTERILLPAMITKLDQEIRQNEIETNSEFSLPLHSQNLSIIEVGNYFSVFEKFVGFVGIKSLVITDIDGSKNKSNEDGTLTEKPCVTEEATFTTNSTLKNYFKPNDDVTHFEWLTNISLEQKRFAFDTNTNWVSQEDGLLTIVYQIDEENTLDKSYHARSFEDAFFHLNQSFLKDLCVKDGVFQKDNPFESLVNKHLKIFLLNASPYEFAENGVSKKPKFAMEVLLNSKNSMQGESEFLYANWYTPHYIREGLKWLRNI